MSKPDTAGACAVVIVGDDGDPLFAHAEGPEELGELVGKHQGDAIVLELVD